MPKRNLVWIAIAAVIAVLLWKVPENFIRRDALFNQFGPLLDVRMEVLKNYVEPIDDKVLLHGAIDGMLNRLDPYSEYYDENELEQFQSKTEGQYEGIGIEVAPVGPGGGLQILSPIEGGPAFYAGLRAGDRIAEIDGKKTDDMTQAEGVNLIKKGKVGSSVTLTLVRPGTAETLKKTVTREVVTVRTVRGWARSDNWDWNYMIDPQRRIAYVRISAFEGHTSNQIDSILQELLARHRMRGLILDVRNNPGGLLPVVVEIANRFIREGVIVSTKGRHTPEQPYLAVRDRALPSFPMAILVNHGSASASEILAGALKDHHRATVIGEQTFGKGSVQELKESDDKKWAVKLTTAYYYLPNGERIHGTGVTPDQVVTLTEQERNKLQDSQLAVYSTSRQPTTTRPATSTAPAEIRIDINADRQLQEALKTVKRQIATQPSEN